MGACMADALQYAHERGLLHLDLKPSNVLLAADGQPMLLDFHLARGPIQPDADEPPWLGGTAGYMSPEQQLALESVQQGRKAPLPVDGRSDLFSLGVVLREALTGLGPGTTDSALPLPHANGQVSIGLADVIDKCLASDPRRRYPDMAALATDLRRHLAHLPLAGVRNRSWRERWRKWRRRRPHGVALAGMMLAVVLAAGAVAIVAANHFTQRLYQARTALQDGQMQMAKGEWEGAITTLQHGLSAARGNPFPGDLAGELDRQLHLAEEKRDAAHRVAAAHELNQLANQVRFLYGADHIAPAALHRLEGSCRAFWDRRVRILERLRRAGSAELEPIVRDDLLDLAIFWADLQVRLAPPGGQGESRPKALAILAEAKVLFGPSPVLDAECQIHGGPAPPAAPAPFTAWEHYALGRALLRAGDLERAVGEVERAVRLEPQGLWPNFYQGLFAYRQDRFADAVTAYSVCIGAAPEAAGCFYNRALAYDSLGRPEAALHDYDQALRLDPTLAVAALNRGMLHYRAQRYDAALTDLKQARELGADPVAVWFDLALVHLACGEPTAARDDLDRALSHDPHHSDARKLRESLRDPR
jgi:tetratricopeptide (TPR) repeat protein